MLRVMTGLFILWMVAKRFSSNVEPSKKEESFTKTKEKMSEFNRKIKDLRKKELKELKKAFEVELISAARNHKTKMMNDLNEKITEIEEILAQKENVEEDKVDNKVYKGGEKIGGVVSGFIKGFKKGLRG